ncbi:MAG: alpha/beta fold hydrolase [Actinomycetota bacterium]
MADTQIFEPDGRAIPFATEGEGPALVLIAGLGLNVSYLGLLAHSVSEEDFRVVRIGSRRPSDAEVAMTDLAQDVLDVMDRLEILDAWVGGHGFGGSVARMVSLTQPERVNGVMLLGVEGEAPAISPADDPEIPADARDTDVESLQRAARDAWAPEALAPGIPVLIIQGAEDRVTPPAHGDELQASAPGLVSVVPIDGGGYMFPLTHVGATSWAIEDYLDWD